MYKVIEYQEDGEKVICSVCSHWETAGVARWPSKINQFMKLRKINDINVNPESDWTVQICTVKRANILTLKEALNEEKKMEVMDTEDEDALTYVQQKYASHTNRPFRQAKHLTMPPNVDLNGMFNFDQPKNVLPNSTLMNRPSIDLLDNGEILIKVNEDNVLDDSINNNCTAQVLVNMEDISQLVTQVATINTQMVSFRADFDSLATFLKKHLAILEVAQAKPLSLAPTCTPETAENPIFKKLPLSCEEDLAELDLVLRNEESLKEFIKKYSKVCGINSQIGGSKASYILVDVIFGRHFLNNCTRTGSSKGSVKKCSLAKYNFLLKAFFEVIHLADNNWDMVKSEKFFYNVLKNSNARTKHKKYSSHIGSSSDVMSPTDITPKPDDSPPVGDCSEYTTEWLAPSAVLANSGEPATTHHV